MTHRLMRLGATYRKTMGERARRAVLWLLVCTFARTGIASAETKVDFIFMEEGAELYTRFGHSAFLVRNPQAPYRVFNFGTTDFTRPDLVTSFLRGHVPFWLSVASWEGTKRAYAAEDRTMIRYELGLSEEKQVWLSQRLAQNALPENRIYAYDHFADNCATRLRDLFDEALGGALKRALAERPFAKTYRDLALQGFSGQVTLQVLADMVLGYGVDRPLNLWEASFHPRYLRQALQATKLPDGTPLLKAGDVIYERKGPPPPETPYEGRRALVVASGLLLIAGWLGRRKAAVRKVLRIGWGVLGGLLGTFLWSLAIYTTVPHLRYNPSLFLFLPLDWWFVRHGSTSVWLGRYQLARLAVILLCGILLRPPLVLVAFAFTALWALGPARTRGISRGAESQPRRAKKK